MNDKQTCKACQDGEKFEMPITMAFQPIVDVGKGTAFAYEALVRGADGESAGSVLSNVSDQNRYAFDQKCRVKAIELASALKLADQGAHLSINFLPQAVYEPKACIRMTLAAAATSHFPLDRIIFEFTEVERLDSSHLLNILNTYRSMGFKTAIDDFGSGFAGLGLLSEFQPDLVKLDMGLIRNIDTCAVKRTIVRNVLNMLRDLGITPVCEGIETVDEYRALRDLGVGLMQGYLLGRPSLASLENPTMPPA
jgi:EAL domain-containing protein (putative c-di-GMP-specific phosphodiesterase class I)